MEKFKREYLPYIVVILLVIITRSFIITPVKVSGKSMYKTLNNGDVLFLYKLAKIDKEDIVVIDKSVSGSRIIKRVIGMPGDTIECKKGKIYINGKKYDDKYSYTLTSDFKKVKLSSDEYFVLGDNRLVSEDSRYFGVVNKEDILGQAVYRIWPIGEAGIVD